MNKIKMSVKEFKVEASSEAPIWVCYSYFQNTITEKYYKPKSEFEEVEY